MKYNEMIPKYTSNDGYKLELLKIVLKCWIQTSIHNFKCWNKIKIQWNNYTFDEFNETIPK
jgi:hypothetical protein